MDGSVGQALRDARLQKKLTIEEVARATKIRPDRVADLEKDDYGRFPNLAYARSFLLLYAKFLGVDVSKYHIVEVGSSTSVGDYQYLRNERGVDSLRFTEERPQKKPRWMLIFIIFLVALLLGGIAGLFVLDLQRIGLNKPAGSEPAPKPGPASQSTTPASVVAAPSPSASASPVTTGATPNGSPSSPPIAESIVQRALPADGSSPPPVPSSTGTENGILGPEPQVRTAEPATPEEVAAALREQGVPMPSSSPIASPSPDASSSPAATPENGPAHDIAVRVTKKTRVQIFRDNVHSQPIFDDWLKPGMPPVTFRGHRFWIRTPDKEALRVTSDGKSIHGNNKSHNENAPDDGVQIEAP